MKIAKAITIFVFICTIAFWAYGKEVVKKQDAVPPVITSTIDELHVDAHTGVEKAGLKKGISAVIISLALGKSLGSIFYFCCYLMDK